MTDSLFRTEQQYIIGVDLKKVYALYKDLWKDILIPRKEFYENIAIEEIVNEVSQNHLIMYKQNGIVVVDFITYRSTISERFDPMDLSLQLNTTVINYSNWEDKEIRIVTDGLEELSLSLSYDYRQKLTYDLWGRFSKVMEEFERSKEIDVVGEDFENIFKVLNIDINKISRPDFPNLQGAVTFDVYGKW